MTSVVVPVYNGAHVLGRTVPAALALGGVDEWVWVDDGSTDATARVLSDLTGGEPHARVVRLGTNRGRASARNAGVAQARGDTIVFLDADVSPRRGLAEALAEPLARPGALASVARLHVHAPDPSDPYHAYLRHYPRGAPPGVPGSPVSWRYFLAGACALTRAALAEAGGFDERVEYGEDLALACRLAARHPRGLRASRAEAEVDDVGTLETALAKIEAFGRDLALVAETCPGVYEVAGLERLASARADARALRGLARWRLPARLVQGALPLAPAPLVPYGVRYLLGHTLARSTAHAAPRAR